MLLICISLLGLITSNARAALIINFDNVTHTLTIAGDDPDEKHDIAPGGQVESLCAEGCVLRLNASKEDDYIIEGSERLSIENGTLYYDGEITKSSKNDNGNSRDLPGTKEPTGP